MWDELTKDAINMTDVMIRLGDRSDIWQDRFIYWMAKAIYDIIKVLLRYRKDLVDLHS